MSRYEVNPEDNKITDLETGATVPCAIWSNRELSISDVEECVADYESFKDDQSHRVVYDSDTKAWSREPKGDA
jgi:hypothetical protein